MIVLRGAQVQIVCPICRHSWNEAAPERPLVRPPEALLFQLKAWRFAQARQEKRPLWKVFTNADLERIAHVRPQTHKALSVIPGVGERRMEKYADDILRIVGKFLTKEDCSPVNG